MFNLLTFNKSIDDFNLSEYGISLNQEFEEEGIRIVLETLKEPKIIDLREQISIILDSEFSLELMFPDSENINQENVYNLGNFLLLTIHDCIYEAVEKQVFDLAYYLREMLSLRSAEPDIPFKRYYSSQLSLASSCKEPDGGEPKDYAWSLRNMEIPAAWALAPNNNGRAKGAGIRIGHPDTGYSKHDDLDLIRLDVASGYDFVSRKQDPKDPLDYKGKHLNPGHGTATGSVMISVGGVTTAPTGTNFGGTNGKGKVTGVAPEATLIPYRAIKSVIRILSSNIARSVHMATQNNCHVISMSLGGFASRSLHSAIEGAVNRNIIVLAAAGNCVRIVVWPAKYKNCIALAATNINDRPWKGSCRGSEVCVSAPGEYVWCAKRESHTDSSHNEVEGGQGTSFATANAAGVAALWLAFHNLNILSSYCISTSSKMQEVFRELLKKTARVPSVWNGKKFGSGIINAYDLLLARISPPQVITNADDYLYIGHIANLLETSDTQELNKLFNKLFPSIFTAKEVQLHLFELWGHELLIIIFNNDVLRNNMISLLNQNIFDDKHEQILNDVRSVIRKDASLTLANFLAD